MLLWGLDPAATRRLGCSCVSVAIPLDSLCLPSSHFPPLPGSLWLLPSTVLLVCFLFPDSNKSPDIKVGWFLGMQGHAK